jgi:hypothetical protein
MLRNPPARWHIDDLNGQGLAQNIRQLLLRSHDSDPASRGANGEFFVVTGAVR